MSNGNQQRCCLIGTCCPPGGAAQRDAFQAWLTKKVISCIPSISEREAGELVCGWLDELPWETDEATASGSTPAPAPEADSST